MNRRIATIVLSLAVVAVIILVSGCTKQQSKGPLPAPQGVAGTPATEAMPTLTPGAPAPGGATATPQPVAPATGPTVAPSVSATSAPPPEPTATQPAPAVQPTQTPLAAGPTTYTVKLGDWLYKIARQYNVSVYALIQANPSINPNRLQPGQVLNIPGSAAPGPTPVPGTCPSPYTVQPGDTVYSIARKCGKTPSAIITANNLFNPNYILVGQKLQIP